MYKYTKIVATIGPASSGADTLQRLYEAGMNVARINLSHGNKATLSGYIKELRKLDAHFPIILDTKGPEIRTGIIPQGELQVTGGSKLRLVHTGTPAVPGSVTVDYPHLDEIPVGNRILFDDGLVESEVIENKAGEPVIRVMNEGSIGSGKKVTIQGYRVRLPFLTERDQQDILFAMEHRIDLLAASFVRTAANVQVLRDFIAANGSRMKIISKIEQREAVANLDEILRTSDGIMVARGDLGVELPLQEVPGIQEEIIRRCNQAGKPVIVATQMLESMRENMRPTRAEVNDVAHAILQGADAIMLSAETATGRYAVRSVEMMDLIARQYEQNVIGISQVDCLKNDCMLDEGGSTKIAQFITKAAFEASDELGAKAILTPTESGFTACNVSRFKPKSPILAITKDLGVLQMLHLVRGVFPMLDTQGYLDMSHYNMSYHLIRHYYESGTLSTNDRIIITSGSNLMTKRGTNLLEIYAVGDIISDKTNPSRDGVLQS